jgi:hypothetical protein
MKNETALFGFYKFGTLTLLSEFMLFPFSTLIDILNHQNATYLIVA